MHKSLRKTSAFLALSLFIGMAGPALTPASAQTLNEATAPEQAQQTSAGKFIQDLGNKAIAIITDKSLTQEQRADKYREILRKAFDIPAIGRFVLGRAWNTATPQQQQDYLNLFQSLVVKIYGDRLSLYYGEKFHVTGVRQENEKDVVVNSEIDHPGGVQPTSVDWRLHQNNGQLSIIDVTVEGISQSITQRQEYASILERNNGSIDALLDMMRERLQSFSKPNS
jgi:phospholipid transport system substrate-binding protein